MKFTSPHLRSYHLFVKITQSIAFVLEYYMSDAT